MLPSLALAATLLGAVHAGAAPSDLVDVTGVVSSVRLDLRYATADNFLHQAVYPCGRCLLRRSVAEALSRAQAALAAHGRGLLLWDCYRPPEVQRKMWALLPDARYVANPRTGSVHNRGAAVDLTIVDAAGNPLEMPTAFDAFGPAAAADAPASAEAAGNRATLRAAMEAAGFVGIRTEWWHFELAGSRGWPVVEGTLCPAGPGAAPPRQKP